MSCTKLKETLNNSVYKICSDIDSYVYNPGKDYSRVRKLPAENVISYLISQGGSSTKCEFLDFYMLSPETPTVSALNQRRSQLKPDACKAVFMNLQIHTWSLKQCNMIPVINILQRMVLPYLFQVCPVLLPMSIIFLKVILPLVFTVCT